MLTIPVDLVQKLALMLASVAKDEVMTYLKAPDQVRELRERVERIEDVLTDAERRQFDNDNIKNGMKQLKNIIYDADDIIDAYLTEQEKHENEQSAPSSTFLVCCIPLFLNITAYPFRRDIAKKIKAINCNLDRIKNDLIPFNLEQIPRDRDRRTRVSQERSHLVEPILVGEAIREDTKLLVELLIEEAHEKKISVFAIVGMGGIGKTTLAQNIYDQLNSHQERPFQSGWICVTKDFDEIKILCSAITSFGGKLGEIQNKEDLETRLSQVVRNKKVFLVLDDVWGVQVWRNLLRKPLQSCAFGSKVLITTRYNSVASMMGAIFQHKVKKLSDEETWSFLCNMVFQTGEEDDIQALKEIGMQLVKKCDGLPLAVQTISRVLKARDKRQSEWDRVLRSPAWSLSTLPEDVMGVLYLSYEDLPLPLKRCFLSFALFSSDVHYQIRLTRFWIAQGFVEANGDLTMEEVAIEYWNELIQRNLIENYYKYDKSCCNMHDLLCSLAESMLNGDCFIGNVSEFKTRMTAASLSSKPRHAIIVDNEEEKYPNIGEQPFLRTLNINAPLIKSFPGNNFNKFKGLRFLDLESSNIEKLPSSIGNLLHLRYLNLSSSQIKEIPPSIENLRNLQFLILRECKNLHYLPASIVTLYKLRQLNLHDTPIDYMPAGIGRRLKNLNFLGGFPVKSSDTSDRRCIFEELQGLDQLRSLSIYHLERVRSSGEARAAALNSKSHLTRLWLYCTSSNEQQYGAEMTARIKEVFEELCPPKSLEFLIIGGYFGTSLPNWMISLSGLPNLRQLSIEDCNLVDTLPPLGMLPQLESLSLQGASAIRRIGPELFLPHGSKFLRGSFRKLKLLDFNNMPYWEGWLSFGDENHTSIRLPCLENLSIAKCPRLRSLPESLLNCATTLKTVHIEGAHSLKEIKNIHYVEVLELADNDNLERVLNLPSLIRLRATRCAALRCVNELNASRQIELIGEAMECLPEWLFTTEGELRFGSLQQLNVEGSADILLDKCCIGGPEWPKIRQIPNFEARISDRSDYISYDRRANTLRTNLPDDKISRVGSSWVPTIICEKAEKRAPIESVRLFGPLRLLSMAGYPRRVKSVELVTPFTDIGFNRFSTSIYTYSPNADDKISGVGNSSGPIIIREEAEERGTNPS